MAIGFYESTRISKIIGSTFKETKKSAKVFLGIKSKLIG